MGRRLPPEKEASIIATYSRNLKIHEVEEIEKVHRRTIYDVLSRNNVPTKYRMTLDIPQAEDRTKARIAAYALTLDRLERHIGPIAISEHLGFAKPYIEVNGNRIRRPEVVDVMNELFALHGELKKTYTKLLEEEK